MLKKHIVVLADMENSKRPETEDELEETQWSRIRNHHVKSHSL